MSNNENFEKSNFDSFFFFALLIKRKWIVIVPVIIAAIASVIITLMMDDWFESTVNVVPPKTSGSAFEGTVSGVSSMLKEFGLTKLAGMKSDGYSFLVILESRTIMDSMISKYNLGEVYDIEPEKMYLIRKSFLKNSEITYESEGNYTVTIWDKDPQRAADMANDYVEIANKHAQYIFHTESKINREYLERRFEMIDSSMNALAVQMDEISRKYLMFSPEDQGRAIAVALSDLKAELMKQEIVYDIVNTKYGENDPMTAIQKDVIRNLREKVKDAESKPGFGGDFALRDIGNIGMRYYRILADLETFAKVKAFLTPMLEEARINENRMLHNLFVVDKAIPADRKSYPKRSLIVLGSVVGVFILAVLYIITVYYFNQFRRKYNELTS